MCVAKGKEWNTFPEATIKSHRKDNELPEAVADLSGQDRPRGAIRVGLSQICLDWLHSVCQQCNLKQPSSCLTVIYTVGLQNIGFTRRWEPLCHLYKHVRRK